MKTKTKIKFKKKKKTQNITMRRIKMKSNNLRFLSSFMQVWPTFKTYTIIK